MTDIITLFFITFIVTIDDDDNKRLSLTPFSTPPEQ